MAPPSNYSAITLFVAAYVALGAMSVVEARGQVPCWNWKTGGPCPVDPAQLDAKMTAIVHVGGVELRAEPLEIRRESLAAPRLSRLNRHFAGAGRPVVDARHVPCRFPDGHERLLAAMDGSHAAEDLAQQARDAFPELDFHRWLAHLADRGVVE